MVNKLTLASVVLATVVSLTRGEDNYLHFIKNAPEFQRVPQERDVMIGRWDTWIYMPWRYRWAIGTGDEGGRFCRDYGFNGGFTDHGHGPFEWLNKWNLRFYNDHTAAKGYLYLHRGSGKRFLAKFQRDGRAIRSGTDGPRPLDEAMLDKLKGIVTRYVTNVKQNSSLRVAYALDDEISWGSFVVPIPWRLNTDDTAYAAWLKDYYGPLGAPEPRYVTPDFTRRQLDRPLKEIDFSPLLDRITYNDSVWANFLGELVLAANKADPDTPCGFVGGQSPSMWGGYDYAKLMKKIQFIEAYNLGSSQAIIRSLNPGNALPQVTTHFHKDSRGTANDIWQTWYYFAHGNRGMIGWVEEWFDGEKPQPWLDRYKATNLEVGGVQGPKMVGSRWIHDGVAVYYSQPSIQVSWCLDIEPHGSTWVNRGSDHRLGTSHNVRMAWEYLLTDSGIQYSFIPYDEVVVHGVPDEYKVLIMPACYALSDMEAQRIAEFCRRGGTVIADFAAGLFDHHGKGRAAGALDELFGVTHDGSETARDFFGDRLWVETDQDAGFSYRRYRDLFATIDCKLEDGYAVAEKKRPTQVVRNIGAGKAVLVNLSPQRYLQYREEAAATDELRRVFMQHVAAAGVEPWVTAMGEGGRRPRNLEITYWSKGDRTLVFVLQNAIVTGSAVGGGGVEGLIDQKTKINIVFREDVHDVADERAGKSLGNGRRFTFDFNCVKAVFLSFQHAPPQHGKDVTNSPGDSR